HRLLLQRCTACGRVRHYPRPVCDNCFAMTHDWIEASRRGRVYSWTVCHHAFDPAFKADLPYALVTVELDEGVRVQAPLRGARADVLRLEQPVTIDFEDVDDTLTLPCVRLAD
ncbi:MAG: OB-fold domain-containing protein, partial [Gammaproteobacteria bacterium]